MKGIDIVGIWPCLSASGGLEHNTTESCLELAKRSTSLVRTFFQRLVLIVWPEREGACRHDTSLRNGSESHGFVFVESSGGAVAGAYASLQTTFPCQAVRGFGSGLPEVPVHAMEIL
jgi:hypothetical protein